MLWSAAGCLEKETNFLSLFSSSVALSSSLSAILIKITPRKKNTICVCVRVCVCVCACVSPFTVKASSAWISWNAREQINDIMLKTFLLYAKYLHHYFRMKLQTFLTSHFILFTYNRSGLSHDLTSVCLAYIKIRPSFNIIRYRPRSAQHRKPIYLWRQALTRGVAIYL